MIVYKYTVPFVQIEELMEFSLVLPENADFMHFQAQWADMSLWFLVNKGNQEEKRDFFLIRTGLEIPFDRSSYEHMKTIQYGDFILHLFEKNKETKIYNGEKVTYLPFKFSKLLRELFVNSNSDMVWVKTDVLPIDDGHMMLHRDSDEARKIRRGKTPCYTIDDLKEVGIVNADNEQEDVWIEKTFNKMLEAQQYRLQEAMKLHPFFCERLNETSN